MINKNISQSFNRAAPYYDLHADFQSKNGFFLFDLIKKHINALNKGALIIDVGCGTGHHLLSFSESYKNFNLKWIGLDYSPQMIQVALKKDHFQKVDWFVSESIALPFNNDAVSIVYSNFALQWCEDIARTFEEVRRVLKSGGVFAFSFPVLGTFDELKKSWASVNQFSHVNDFHSPEQLKKIGENLGFNEAYFLCSRHTLLFNSFFDFASSVKSVGASNKHAKRQKTLTGKNHFNQMLREYEVFRCQNTGMLPATYEVVTAIFIKP